jgi:DNA-binding GntR family transcriptional regulator
MPEEHEAIVSAIAEGDADKARAAADIHIERLKELVIKEGVHQKHI